MANQRNSQSDINVSHSTTHRERGCPSASFLSHHFCHNRSNSHLPLHVKEMINQHQMYFAQPYDNSINYSVQQSVNTEYFTNSPITRDCDSGQTSAVVSMLQTQDGCRFRTEVYDVGCMLGITWIAK